MGAGTVTLIDPVRRLDATVAAAIDLGLADIEPLTDAFVAAVKSPDGRVRARARLWLHRMAGAAALNA